jgi:hypothetical protein
MEMALTPREIKEKTDSGEEGRPKIPWVSWIAIILGVTMSAIGIMLLLWGFAWQTDVGEPQNIDGDDLRGGPCLIPMGGAMLLIGLMWVLTGWRGFKRDRSREDMQICRNCGKMIEADLNFCYYCNKTFDEVEEETTGESRRGRTEKKPNVDEGSSKDDRKKARPFSPEDK